MRDQLDVDLAEAHALSCRWKLNFSLNFNHHSRLWHARISPPRQKRAWESRNERPYGAIAEAVFLARTDLGISHDLH